MVLRFTAIHVQLYIYREIQRSSVNVQCQSASVLLGRQVGGLRT